MRRFRLGMLLLCCLLLCTFAGVATAWEEAWPYRIEEANSIGYPQSTWENNGVVELTDIRNVAMLAAMLAEAKVPMDQPFTPVSYGKLDSYKITSGPREMMMYYDSLYENTYMVEGGLTYLLPESTGRYVRNLFDAGEWLAADIPEAHAALFVQYGWTPSYIIGEQKMALPKELYVSPANEAATYFCYRNLFMKDAAYDITPYLGQEVTVSIYRIFEGINRVKWCPEDVPLLDQGLGVTIEMRGVVLSQGDTIIGAFLDAGRHDATFAVSLANHSDWDILQGKPLLTFLLENARFTAAEKELVGLSPEELIQRFCAVKTSQKAVAFYDHVTMLEMLCVNMEDDQLFVPWTQWFTAGRSGLKSVVHYPILEDASMFRVEFKDGSEYFPHLVYEGEAVGWRIESFYNGM